MSESQPARKLLLVGWDAADWKFINPLLDAGRMPNLSRLVDGGVIANLATLQPCLSPILWTSIATGKTADKHGVAGFIEPIPGGAGVRPVSSTSRTTKAIWNILSQNDLTSTVVNWYASHPAEPIRGTCISNRFFENYPRTVDEGWDPVPGSVQPEKLRDVLTHLRMHPSELGSAEMGRLIPDIHRIDWHTDKRPWQLAEIVARTVSIHSVVTHLMTHEPWDFISVYYDGLDVAGHIFMPFHPPRRSCIAEDEFSAYCHVMRELYLFHDEMLGRLLELAGPDATVMVVSDHGFHCDHLRPAVSAEPADEQAAAWHRQYGVFALRGPGVLNDERIYGATLLDIAPTVLQLFGLPIGRDMDGRPLLQALVNPPEFPRTIASWDQQPGAHGMHPSDLQRSMMESPAAVAQLIALGYLPPETAESRNAVAIASAELQFNLAIVHSSMGRTRQAIELLTDLFEWRPESTRYGAALAKALANDGQLERCRAIVASLEAGGWHSADADLLVATALFNEGQADAATARLAHCERRYPPSPQLYQLIGNIHLARRNWQDAATAFDKALALDDDSPNVHDGAAHAALKLGDFEKAAEHALRAIGLLFYCPQAHVHLGMALKGMGESLRAARSLKLAISQAPKFFEAHQELENLKEDSSVPK
jgi:predicted AlkP superfamily phosphohydrolase/phosphomutase/tetratricopeptide (TPR) repeat protein